MKNWTHTLQTSSHSDPLLKLKKKHDIPSAGFGWRFSHMYIERRKDNVAFICGRLGCVCSPDFHSCKSRNRRSKFKSGDCNPHSCSSYYGLGDCISHRRTKWYIGNQQKKLAVSYFVRTGNGSVMALLLQGHTAWKCVKGCADR